MQYGQVYCENGPLHGQTIVLHELLKMRLSGGFYMRNEHHAAPKKCSWSTWVCAEDMSVVVQIGGCSHDTTVDTGRIDRGGLTWLRLRKSGMEHALYLRWKQESDDHSPVSLVFRGEKYEGRTDLVGMNETEKYIFLQFTGQKTRVTNSRS